MPQADEKLLRLAANVDKLDVALSDLIAKVTILETRMQDTRVYIEGSREVIEETKNLLNEIDKKASLVTALHTTLTETVKGLKDTLENKYVSKTEFEPIKKIVYSVAGTMLMAIVGALIKLVLH